MMTAAGHMVRSVGNRLQTIRRYSLEQRGTARPGLANALLRPRSKWTSRDVASTWVIQGVHDSWRSVFGLWIF